MLSYYVNFLFYFSRTCSRATKPTFAKNAKRLKDKRRNRAELIGVMRYDSLKYLEYHLYELFGVHLYTCNEIPYKTRLTPRALFTNSEHGYNVSGTRCLHCVRIYTGSQNPFSNEILNRFPFPSYQIHLQPSS